MKGKKHPPGRPPFECANSRCQGHAAGEDQAPMEPPDNTTSVERGFAIDFLEEAPLIRDEDGSARAPQLDLDMYVEKVQKEVQMRSEESDGVAAVAEEARLGGGEPASASGPSLMQDVEGALQQVLHNGNELQNTLTSDIPVPPPRHSGIARDLRALLQRAHREAGADKTRSPSGIRELRMDLFRKDCIRPMGLFMRMVDVRSREAKDSPGAQEAMLAEMQQMIDHGCFDLEQVEEWAEVCERDPTSQIVSAMMVLGTKNIERSSEHHKWKRRLVALPPE